MRSFLPTNSYVPFSTVYLLLRAMHKFLATASCQNSSLQVSNSRTKSKRQAPLNSSDEKVDVAEHGSEISIGYVLINPSEVTLVSTFSILEPKGIIYYCNLLSI